MTEPNTCVRGCRTYGQHKPDCPGNTCRGCLPRPSGAGHICSTCYQRLHHWLTTELKTTHQWLNTNLGQHIPGIDYNRDRIDTSRTPRPPIRLTVLEAQTAITDTLMGWEDAIRDHYHQPTPRRFTLNRACTYLAATLPRLDTDPTGIDILTLMWDELDTILRDAHRAAPWRALNRHLDGIPCPNCERTTLTIYGGTTDATCRTCDRIYTREQYDRWTALLAWQTEQETG